MRRLGAAQLARDLAQIQPRHLVLQRAQRDAEIPRSRGDVPVGLLERPEDEIALERIARLLKQRLAGGRPRIELGEVVFEREVLVGDPLLVAHRDQPLDQVLELADVARATSTTPGSSALNPRCRAPACGTSCLIAIEEKPGELRQILEPVAERRHPDRDDVDPVIQVLPEPPVLDRLLQIDVGRDDQAEVGLDWLGSADPLDFPLLNRAQQLGLEIEPQVADFVEEQRAAARQLELARVAACARR